MIFYRKLPWPDPCPPISENIPGKLTLAQVQSDKGRVVGREVEEDRKRREGRGKG
jgi:hypothetical protein